MRRILIRSLELRMTFAAVLFGALRWERAYILHIGQSTNLKNNQNCLKELQVKTTLTYPIQLGASLKYF